MRFTGTCLYASWFGTIDTQKANKEMNSRTDEEKEKIRVKDGGTNLRERLSLHHMAVGLERER